VFLIRNYGTCISSLTDGRFLAQILALMFVGARSYVLWSPLQSTGTSRLVIFASFRFIFLAGFAWLGLDLLTERRYAPIMLVYRKVRPFPSPADPSSHCQFVFPCNSASTRPRYAPEGKSAFGFLPLIPAPWPDTLFESSNVVTMQVYHQVFVSTAFDLNLVH
jgi:hypothetical protein